MGRFHRFELRTTDADGARAFYRSIFGHDRAVIWPLHEQALARGARPHWLGYLDVEDVEVATRRFVERGATLLGPAPPAGGGARGAVLRDPGGALVAVAPSPTADFEPAVRVAWHVLNTNDAARAISNYCELFGWAPAQEVELGAEGAFREFAWQPGGESVGALGDIAGRPRVHSHWLFFFEVEELDRAMAATRAGGGVALEPIALPNGLRLGVCDDPQGAAFGLCERHPSR